MEIKTQTDSEGTTLYNIKHGGEHFSVSIEDGGEGALVVTVTGKDDKLFVRKNIVI